MIDIINKKRLNQELTKAELERIIMGYVNGVLPDYQMSAFLMAIAINGMSEEETINLTNILYKSGDVIDLSKIEGIKVDKHSTGGIGDKTTLILAPLLACLNIPVAKMSGRGLGITGGTIDKLEAIKGFNTILSEKEFIENVKEVGACIMGTSANLVPADKKIYALRDVTATVCSIPLIASSIMSKKLAGGADKILIDLKVGEGALINNIIDAQKLGKLLVKIGSIYNKETVCVLTKMNEPLGYSVGNTLEIKEVINFLKGTQRAEDLEEIIIELATQMLKLGKNENDLQARKKVKEMLNSDLPYQKFAQIVEKQGGTLTQLKDKAKTLCIKSVKEGYINHIDAFNLGNIVNQLGAGKMKLDDKIDHAVGIVLKKKSGDYVYIGEEIATVYYNEHDIKLKDILACFDIQNEKVTKQPMIIQTIY